MIIEDNITIRNCIFSFKCEMNWGKLNETDVDNIKFCSNCQKEVYFCETDEELVEAVKRNKCVGIIKPFAYEVMLGEVELQNIKNS